MDFLKNLFGLDKGPQVLPGAQAPASKSSDIANILARAFGAAGAGMSAAEGQPQQAQPGWLSALQRKPQPMGGTTRDQTIGSLLGRIFGVENTPAPNMGTMPMSNQIPIMNDKPKASDLY